MLMGEALLERLKADAGVAAIAATRVHWQRRPQGEDLPAVVLTVIGEDRPQHLGGFEDMATSRVQASCFAEHYGEARHLAEAVIAAVAPPATVVDAEDGDILFWRAGADGPRDLGDQTDTGFIYHAAVDLIVRWGRAEAA